MSGKNILVAGGSGFIGSHVCKKLLDRENTVVCLDNLTTGNKKNIEPFLKNKNFYFIEEDTRTDFINYQLPITSYHEIYDLASPASVTHITDHPIESATVNSIGVKNMLDLAHKNRAKFLFASSSEAYGDPKEHPQKESYWGNVNPVGVRSGYDEGKRFGEALTMAYHREKKLDTKIARIFNTYGPNSDPKDSRVIPSFVTSAITGKPLTVHGDGSQTRSFCYVSDLAEGLIKLMEGNYNFPINLGNTYEYKIKDIVKKIIEKTNSKSEIVYVKRPEDDPSRRRPDIMLALKKIEWKPKTKLDYGLEKTISYFRTLGV